MPATSDRRVYSFPSRGAGYAIHVVIQRLKRTNLPFLVAFASSLFMFLRALSGAGYVDPHRPPASALSFNDSHLTTTDSGSPNGHVYAGGFAEHWTRFKEAFLSCSPENVAGEGVVGNGMELGHLGAEGDGVDTKLSKASPTPTSPRRVGVGCLKERLSGAIGLHNGPAANAPVVKPEDRAFKISLEGVPSWRKGNDAHPERRLR